MKWRNSLQHQLWWNSKLWISWDTNTIPVKGIKLLTKAIGNDVSALKLSLCKLFGYMNLSNLVLTLLTPSRRRKGNINNLQEVGNMLVSNLMRFIELTYYYQEKWLAQSIDGLAGLNRFYCDFSLFFLSGSPFFVSLFFLSFLSLFLFFLAYDFETISIFLKISLRFVLSLSCFRVLFLECFSQSSLTARNDLNCRNGFRWGVRAVFSRLLFQAD